MNQNLHRHKNGISLDRANITDYANLGTIGDATMAEIIEHWQFGRQNRATGTSVAGCR